MAKVITFSRTFPSYHPRKGEPTYFVEKIVGGLVANDVLRCGTELIKGLRDCGWLKIANMTDNNKHHTIRAGHRFKVGDWFSPRVWSGKPYNSKQIVIAPDIQVKKVWDIALLIRGDFKEFYTPHTDITKTSINEVAKNDGLSIDDFLNWFPKPFDGQIICWNDQIEY